MNNNYNDLYSSANENVGNGYTHPPNKKFNFRILIIIAIVIAIITGGIFVFKLFSNTDNNEKQNLTKSITASTSFWIRNNENLYAMFDINGKQLTGFDFTSVSSSFVNGTAEVRNRNNEYGLISSNGEMIIEFGKYDLISSQYAVYEMTDKDYNKFLYNSYGKFIRELDDEKNEDIESFVGEYTYALIESDYDYKVIDYNGKEITTITIPEDDDDIYSPTANSKDNYVSIFYNNVSYIIDISKGEVLLTIPDSRRFCIDDVNEENPTDFILATCNTSYGSEQKKGFKLVKNGKVVYSKEAGKYASMSFQGNNIVYEDDNAYLLDENGNEKTKINSYVIYKDYKNYIRQADGVLNGAELYVDGVLKEKFDCDTIQGGYANHGVYLLEHCSGFGTGNEIYINSDGTRINDKSYQRAYEFDENGYASVSEDAKNFYLINLKGEKVSDYYSNNSTAEKIYNVNGTDNLYYGTNEDGTKTIFEINGKKLLTGEITFSQVNSTAEGNFVIVEKDNQYTVHNLLNDKDIVILNTKPNMTVNYFTTSENHKKQYYSYTTGKLFYEE